MYRVSVREPGSIDEFRGLARGLIAREAFPNDVTWALGNDGDLFAGDTAPAAGHAVPVPSSFLPMADAVICHSDPHRYALLYEALWRLTHGERELLSVAVDPLVHRLHRMEKSVRRDTHKMTAFLRFRCVATDAGEHYIAWFEPEHFILRRVSQFFVDRYASMRWSILTPQGSMHWDGKELAFASGVSRSEQPREDALEDWWRTYYRATFNPARANPAALRAEMPKKYWHNLPESDLIPGLLAEARTRTSDMVASPPSTARRVRGPEVRDEPVAAPKSLAQLRAAAQGCERCPLYKDATQTVFGEGPQDAPVVFVGEQPGDQEDLAGKPFVGPAGKLFDQALAEAGIDRKRVYVTNAVKHFKFEPRGKRRLHKKPNTSEIELCKWWLDRELTLVQPKLVVALGATAARALLGRAVTISGTRGAFMPLPDRGTGETFVTIHPSALLRTPDPDTREREYAQFVADLRAIAGHVPAIRA
jgi:DNA polymerase